jgi:hypothetical protein
MKGIQYLAFAIRLAKDDDAEADFLVDGNLFVIEATEIIESAQIKSTHNSMQQYYPHCTIMVISTTLVSMLSLNVELVQIEGDMQKLGIDHTGKRNDRISKTFG